MKIEIEIPDPPEGWVYDGVRQAQVGELRLSRWPNKGWIVQAGTDSTTLTYPVAIKKPILWIEAQKLPCYAQARMTFMDNLSVCVIAHNPVEDYYTIISRASLDSYHVSAERLFPCPDEETSDSSM